MSRVDSVDQTFAFRAASASSDGFTGARGAILAFDTPPLARDRRALGDYTSLQLYSATGLQLFRFDARAITLLPSACCNWAMSADGTVHAFRISEFGGHSAKTLAEGFAHGIVAAVKAGAPAGRRFGNISELEVRTVVGGGAELVIRLMQPDRQVGHKLAHPSFAAESFPGPFAWQERDHLGGRLLRLGTGHTKASLHLEYRVLNDPEVGLAAYDAGAIDATCPVLHSPAMLRGLLGRSDLVVGRSNTFMVLFPMSPHALQLQSRRRLKDHLDLPDLVRRFTPTLSSVRGFSRLSLSNPQTSREERSRFLMEQDRPKPLVLAYDPFPPNRDVLEVIAEGCEAGATLVADDFASPAANCDFRLVILVNSHAYEADAYRMIGQTEAVRNDRVLQECWWRQIARYDAGVDEAARAAAIHNLDDLLAEACPAILLGRMNAYHLQRPGIEWLDLASDVSWERCQ